MILQMDMLLLIERISFALLLGEALSRWRTNQLDVVRHDGLRALKAPPHPAD